MAFITRRHFVRQSALTASALYAFSKASVYEQVFSGAEPSASAIDPAAVRELGSKLSGRLITKESSEYQTARLVFNRAYDQHPSLIVRCANESDVARGLEFVQKWNCPLAVRSGGHSRAGFGVCDDGVVIDLSAMNHVEVDAKKRIARAQGGALLRNFDGALEPTGLATTAGGCPNVGLAGFTLGGGEGILMSIHGAGCDNLVSARVVMADGRQVDASAESNPDLFWAIRGGGGNFGIVTALEYQLHPIGKVLAGALTYAGAGRIPELLQFFARFTEGSPDEMVPLGEILPSPEGPVFINHLCYVGEAKVGNQLLVPARSLKPKSDDLRVMSYFEMQAGGFTPPPAAHFQADLIVPQLNGPVTTAIGTAIDGAPPLCRVLVVPFYGAITRVPTDAMAFALRQPGYEIDIQCRWDNATERDIAIAWVKNLENTLKPLARSVYVNQTTETGTDVVKSAYGPNYARLVQIKKKYDPSNLLRMNQNIRPT